MINNFFEVVAQTFNELCNEKSSINLRKQNVAEVTFRDFSISLYYCPYEYDLELNYCKEGKEKLINQVLQELGCSSNQLPKYKYMSNEEVMANYLTEYIVLINRYFKELINFNVN